ncbi:hypothetical protein Micbo1qcDRAFT_19083 [Microdochium bolleyi]|uniref:Rhodopsin domain-containing protein n=1 Tax=Microdochium bolleyi TaxID=196109 RepID=A0A136ITL0_9PEZI|nr:hypothetical protein Micbo1qcDRAFT_19083 [Microdochium bolleyi]
MFFVGEILYIFIVPMTKISVLIFYLQIFPERIYKRATIGLIILNVLYLIAFLVTTVFQCTPVSGAWMTWDGTFEASCRSLNKQVWAAATTSIVLDVAMLVLPMPALWKLNMSLRKKLQVMFMFSLGLFVTIVSILRLQYIVTFATTRNPTQDFVPVGIWSVVEVSVGIICACLPALRSLLSRVLPRVFGTTVNTAKSSQFTQSHIRVKSEFTVQSQQSRRPDEDSSIELILHDPSTGRSLQRPRPVRPQDRRNTRELKADIEAAMTAAAATYPRDRRDSAHSMAAPPRTLP